MRGSIAIAAIAFLCAAAVWFVGCSGPAVGGGKQSPEQGRYVRDEVIVKFKPGIDATDVAKLAQKAGVVVDRLIMAPGTYLMKIPDGESVPEVILRLKICRTWSMPSPIIL